jgi:hypothetical protein
MITTATPIIAAEAQTAQSKPTSIIPLLNQAGFNSMNPDTAQRISNYILQQRVQEYCEATQQGVKGNPRKIVQPISAEEIIAHAEAIRDIINPPKQETPRQTGNALASVDYNRF